MLIEQDLGKQGWKKMRPPQDRRNIRRTKEGRKKRWTHRESLTRWSYSHVLLAVHDEATHWLAIWIVGSSLTYCGWRRQGGRDGRVGGREQSGQLVLLIKAQQPEQDHLLAGARTGSHCCPSASFCYVSVQLALPCKHPVDFNAAKHSKRDQNKSLKFTMVL